LKFPFKVQDITSSISGQNIIYALRDEYIKTIDPVIAGTWGKTQPGCRLPKD
jgi:hypothetical protein